jgi:GTP-binding protein EngB required for normal cell division
MKKAIQKSGIALAFISIITFTAVDAMAQYGYGRGDGPGYGKRGYGYHHKGRRHHKRGHFRHIDFLKQHLQLSEAQVYKIMDIQHEFRKKAYKNRGNRTKMLELKLEMRKKILTILNADQKKKFEALPRHRRHHRCPRGMRR